MLKKERLPLGLKVIIGFHFVSFVFWFFGQTLAVIDYDLVAGWGLQDARERIDPVIVQVNRAIGLADTIIMLPLHLVAGIGLLRRRFFGAVASWIVFGISAYWPVVFWCSQSFYKEADITHVPISAAVIVLPALVVLISCWGSWYLARNRGLFQ